MNNLMQDKTCPNCAAPYFKSVCVIHATRVFYKCGTQECSTPESIYVSQSDACQYAKELARAKDEEITRLKYALIQERDAKNAAYSERNQCVALIAKMALSFGLKAGRAITAIEGWEPEWHNCVYINLPTGQVSWHYHDKESHLFDCLPEYNQKWDGHSTEEKYQRVNASFPLDRKHNEEKLPDSMSLGDKLWHLIMQQCNRHFIHPASANDLFNIIGEVRKFQEKFDSFNNETEHLREQISFLTKQNEQLKVKLNTSREQSAELLRTVRAGNLSSE